MNRKIPYSQMISADRRLVVLQALAEDPGYSHNESVLQSILEMFGHQVSRDQLRTMLAWLAEQGLVTTCDVGNIIVAELTSRGADVAAGRATVPGVRRPAPGN